MAGDRQQEYEPEALPAPVRLGYLCIGWTAFSMGIVGAFLPVLPTTLFMIVALWAFSKSSVRFQRWLYHHRVFGPPLQRWHEYRVIPLSAKIAALGMMTASMAYLVIFAAASWPILLATGALMAAGAGYILSKPSQVPAAQQDS